MTRVQFCPVCGKKTELVQGQNAFGVLWETLQCKNKKCLAVSSVVREQAKGGAK